MTVAALMLPLGSLITWSDKLGVVVDSVDGRVRVRFDDGEVLTFNESSAAVKRVIFEAGDQVTRVGSNDVGVVLQPMPGASPSWQVAFPGGLITTVAEAGSSYCQHVKYAT